MQHPESDAPPARRSPRLSLAAAPPPLHWAALLALSVVFVAALGLLRLPAAVLLGPMAAGILVAISGGEPRVPRPAFFAAQGVIGCMIAISIPIFTIQKIADDWPLMLGSVAFVVVASNALGFALARWGLLPGTTAVWGSSPGAASAMTLMSESYGADIRLVAFMQYTRVVVVVLVASVAIRMWGGADPGATGMTWFPAVRWLPLAETAAIAIGGAWLGRALRVPAGPLLIPLVATLALQGSGLATLDLPPWLLALSYSVVGWSIGLRFTRPIILHAVRALPQVLGSILALIAVCGGFGACLTIFAGIDPLTAFLATSPGGADSVAIIAAFSNVDLPFVMALQTARLLVVIATGPAIARFVARHAARR
ncbi:AbrB family transcriptional regulator [Hansschlegelia beijingensis]|uniref:AbrB family transcriptional regulator n=1 Tax=Hansschlegelia beijingensis TaxID=1133344 RepID=A0A7W6CUZ8_9HYPH|nr:AbrB family transcriptional regulator [Hansschlegelia beijingensis]MBB3971588.1 hypothetical protein [Hansschlegelia beijingensis]